MPFLGIILNISNDDIIGSIEQPPWIVYNKGLDCAESGFVAKKSFIISNPRRFFWTSESNNENASHHVSLESHFYRNMTIKDFI